MIDNDEFVITHYHSSLTSFRQSPFFWNSYSPKKLSEFPSVGPTSPRLRCS
ncbi:hypothetical protein AB205_0034340 [Aquarana catesbeiana]|uniref:Uncharacterized protein n=1 Tax=Aquarana catesbeiana TaxID=8400 RepID=A0A2G9REC7_AQUCT|nr:hypothetical protein AB205_0034340 [Aquarana catesbeiana]